MKMKYTQNLKVAGGKVYSYNTHVATISGGTLLVHGHWSKTTSKHINHVAKEYELTKVNSPQQTDTQDDAGGMLKTYARLWPWTRPFAAPVARTFRVRAGAGFLKGKTK